MVSNDEMLETQHLAGGQRWLVYHIKNAPHRALIDVQIFEYQEYGTLGAVSGSRCY